MEEKTVFTENAYNAVQDLLSIYGLTISPNEVVDAFNKKNEAAASIRELTNNRKYLIAFFFPQSLIDLRFIFLSCIFLIESVKV